MASMIQAVHAFKKGSMRWPGMVTFHAQRARFRNYSPDLHHSRPLRRGGCYSPAITDFVFMVEKTAYMYITGPEVVKTVMRQEVTHEDLGGASVHRSKSGVAHFVASNEANLLSAGPLVIILPAIQ